MPLGPHGRRRTARGTRVSAVGRRVRPGPWDAPAASMQDAPDRSAVWRDSPLGRAPARTAGAPQKSRIPRARSRGGCSPTIPRGSERRGRPLGPAPDGRSAPRPHPGPGESGDGGTPGSPTGPMTALSSAPGGHHGASRRASGAGIPAQRDNARAQRLPTPVRADR